MEYWTEHRERLFADWYAEQDEDFKAAFDTTMNTLAATEDWSELEEFKELSKGHRGLCEIKLDILRKPTTVGEKRQVIHYRIAGFFGGLDEFVLVLGCTKSGRIYTPLNAFEIALDLKRKFVEHGKGTKHDYSF